MYNYKRHKHLATFAYQQPIERIRSTKSKVGKFCRPRVFHFLSTLDAAILRLPLFLDVLNLKVLGPDIIATEDASSGVNRIELIVKSLSTRDLLDELALWRQNVYPQGGAR